MAAVDTILPIVCTLHHGKLFASAVATAFNHTATGSVAGHNELLASVEQALQMIEVPDIELQVIGKLQEADQEMAEAQRKAHHLLSNDTTLEALDVIVKRAFTSILDPSLRKKVATTTSFIETLATMYRLKNYGWSSRSGDAVMGLTAKYTYEVDSHTSFAVILAEYWDDVRRRTEPVAKTKLSNTGMGTLIALKYLPYTDDVVQSQMMVALKAAAIRTTRQPDLTLEEAETQVRKDLEKYLPVMDQPGNYKEEVLELSSKAYVATRKTEYESSSSVKALAKKANFNTHLKKKILLEGSPGDPEFVQSGQEHRQPGMRERKEDRGPREDPERWPRPGQLQERDGGSRAEWPRRTDDAIRGDRAGRGKSPSRDQERQRNGQRDNTCWAGVDCSRLYNNTCRWQHSQEEHEAAAAYNAGGTRGRSPGRQRIEQIEPAHPDELPEQQRTYTSSYMAVVEPAQKRTYASSYMAVKEALKIPVKNLQWSQQFSFQRFDERKPPDTVNARIVKAFDVFDKRRQEERKYGIESGMKKQPQIRHPPKRPVPKSILSVKAHPFQPGGVPDSASSVGPSTGARQEEMPLVSDADGKWAAQRAWLLEQAANQSPAEKQAFSKKHKGNDLEEIIGWMDEITQFEIDGDGRRVVQLPPYVEEKRSLILATMSVPTRWQILIDTCAEVVLIGTNVPHLKIGPSNVVVKGVGNELTEALYQAAFYVLREADGVILELSLIHI